MRTLSAPFLCIAAALLAGCGSSLDLPSAEESRASAADHRTRTAALDSSINAAAAGLPGGADIVSRTRLSAVNRLLDRVTAAGTKDVHVEFLATRPLWREETTVLGIPVVNHIDIESGRLDIDLKRFRFTGTDANTLTAEIEIEGEGRAAVSGRYAGVPASASPTARFYLRDSIRFVIAAADSDAVRLTPLPKTVMLKTKVSVSLLGWNVPYDREIPLSSTDLIRPVVVPSALRSEIVFPLPAAQYGEQRLEYVRRFISFTRSSVRTVNGVLEYRGTIDLTKE
ncbi:MAG: hypothetical protein F9K22_10065 [Bacteroidetes bacterium]|nr:MAG: hypothetical protein F9K22_10065 [Bacteroidota bacterium]